eukprot:SAG22_NODE_43_length_25304_cov_5.394644_6_plen_175_part_00
MPQLPLRARLATFDRPLGGFGGGDGPAAGAAGLHAVVDGGCQPRHQVWPVVRVPPSDRSWTRGRLAGAPAAPSSSSDSSWSERSGAAAVAAVKLAFGGDSCRSWPTMPSGGGDVGGGGAGLLAPPAAAARLARVLAGIRPRSGAASHRAAYPSWGEGTALRVCCGQAEHATLYG